jgi:anti-anti-sigma factor
MLFFFDTSVSENGLIIEVSGTLFVETGKALLERVRHALAANQREIVLKLDDVTKIDSSGVGYLVAALTIVTNAAGSVKFVFNPYVEGVIRDCHFC